jgi:hypothetical protein
MSDLPIELPYTAKLGKLWLSGYTYRKQGAVNATTAGAQTNFQLKLLVGESSGATGEDVDCAGHCQDFPNDIRFTEEDGGTKYDYWVDIRSLEGVTPNRKVSVWIEVTSIPTSGSVDFYMYYGKTSDTGESNGTDTFLCFDDASAYNQEVHQVEKHVNSPSITKLDNGYVLLAYYHSGNKWIKVYRSTNNGESWSLRSTPYANSNSHPDIVSVGSNDVWIVCRDGSNVHTKKSSDGGATWASAVNVRASSGIYDTAILYVSSGLLLVAIADNVASPKEIEIWKSINGGTSWTFVINAVTGTVTYEDLNLVKAPNGNIILTYEKEWVEASHSGVYCVRSTDNGATWGSEITILDNGTSDNEGGTILVDGSNMYHFVPTDEDKGSGSYKENNIKRLTSTDNGVTWGSKTLIMDTKFTVEPCIIKTADNKVLFFGVRQFSGTSQYIYQVEIDMAAPKLFGTKWSQDSGVIYSMMDGSDKVLAVEGRYNATQRAFIVNSVNIADCIIEYSAKSKGSSFDIRSILRYTDTDNHYLADHTAGAMEFYKRVAGAYTQLDVDGAGGIVDTWYDYKVQGLGETFKTWVNDVARNDVNDATYTTGKTGLSSPHAAASNPNYFRDYRVRKYVSPEPTWGSWGVEEVDEGVDSVALWIPPLSKQNFTITYDENDIPRFSFTLQNCSINRTALEDHFDDAFVIYRGGTPIFTGLINCDQIEYRSFDQINVKGFAKWIELGNTIYKRMADADAESADAVFIRNHPSAWTDRTTAAGNNTINDVTVTFNGTGDGIYMGDNDRFNSIKVKYSTKGIQTGTPTFNVQYSKGSDVWATLDCVDESREFTNDPGAYFIFMPTLPSDWSKDTVNSSSKYWIRIVLATGSYSTEPKLDRIWISQTDVCRVQFDNTAANTILDLVLTDTGYSVDGTDQCPSSVIPSIRGEYDSKLRWVAGIINALEWEDENEDAQPYAWWIDASKKVHVKQVRGGSYGDITAKLTVLGNRLNYFDIANRIFGLGGGTGGNQYHAIVENRSAQDTLGEIRETTYNDSRIFDHTLLKGQSGKLLTQSKTAKAQVKCSMPTYNWFEEGYEIGDRIKLHHPKWGIPDETEYAIRRVDISLDTVNFDVGIGREHLDNLQGNMQRQMNIQDVYMQGETSTFQVGPVEANYQRVNDTTVYPVKMRIEIPSNAKAINKALISWKLGPYRASTTGTGTGGGHLHEPATPNTGLGGGHAHGDWVGLGGGITPIGVGHQHTHTILGTIWRLADWQVDAYILKSINMSSESTHTHTNPSTASAGSHGHPAPSCGSSNSNVSACTTIGYGSSCTSGACVDDASTYFHNVALSGHTHTIGSISSAGSHSHTQGNTGGGIGHTHTLTGVAGPYNIPIPSTETWGLNASATYNEDPAHGLTINTIDDHDDHSIDTLNDFSLTVPDTDTEPDFSLPLTYGMYEGASGTIMELIINDVTVGSAYDGDMTDLNIRGYLQNGNNNVILQPAVGQNHKGSAQLDSKIKVFMDTD